MEGEKIFTTCEDSFIVEYKNFLIIILLSLFILVILGINICALFSGVVDFLVGIFAPIFRNVLDMFGYSIGSALNASAQDVKQGVMTGVDIAGDSVSDAGKIIMDQSKDNFSTLDNLINSAPEAMTNPEPTPLIASNPIQSLSR
jgi:hypothetical protein